MPVMKAERFSPMIKEAVVLDLGDIGKQAARLRADAQAKAAAIIAHAEAQAKTLIAGAEQKGLDQGRATGTQQGLVQGREQGRAEALAQAKPELTALCQTWSQTAAKLEEHRSQLEAEARRTVLTFALRVAEKVVHRTIEVDPSVIVDQVAAALAHVLRPLDVTIRIHQDDRPHLEPAIGDLLAEFNHLTHLHLVDDPGVEQGGCVLLFGQGRIDATIQTQIDRIVAMMLPNGEQEELPELRQDAKSPRRQEEQEEKK